MTGGGGQKNIWGAQINFTLIFGKDQKKGLHPGHLPSFEAQVSLEEARSLPDGARWNLMVRISLLAHKFRDKDQKKGFRREIVGSVMAFTRVFLLETKFYSRLEGHKQYFWGAEVAKCTPVAPGLLLSFRAQSSLVGAHFSLEGARAVIWGARPRNSPRGTGPELKLGYRLLI